jgi:hypothetical protein
MHYFNERLYSFRTRNGSEVLVCGSDMLSSQHDNH